METLSRPLLLLFFLPALAGVLWAERLQGPRPLRNNTRAALRLLVAALLVLAASGPVLPRGRTRPPVAVLLDVSDSTGRGRLCLETYRELLDALPDGTRFVPMLFAGRARASAPETVEGDLAGAAKDLRPEDTDLALAIREALGALGGEGPGAIALVSDGQGDLAGAIEAAIECRSRGVAVYAFPAPEELRDLRVDGVSAPSVIERGRPVKLSVQVSGTVSGEAELLLTRTPGPWTRRASLPVSREAPSRVVFQDSPPGPGVYYYEARVRSGSPDDIPRNDVAEAAVLVAGRTRILIAGRAGLAGLLEGSGERHELVKEPPSRLPVSSRGLAGFSVVVLDGPARGDVSRAAEDALVGFVKSGGGLLFVGGPDSLGAGAFRDEDPLVRILPVLVRPPPEERAFLVLMLDASGSMAEPFGGEAKMEHARRALAAALDELSPGDEVALVAFRDEAGLVVRAKASERRKILGQVSEIRAEGRTSLSAPLRLGLELMRQTSAEKKMAFLISDGEPTVPETMPELLELAGAFPGAGGPLHALGTGSLKRHQELLSALAASGGGRAEFEPSYLRLKETLRRIISLRRAGYVRLGEIKVFKARPGHKTCEGLADLPALYGLNRTSLRPGSQLALVSDRNEPVLGLRTVAPGRTGCLASSFAPPWGRDLLSWPGAGRLISQTVRWLSPPPSGDVKLRVSRPGGPGAGGRTRLVIETAPLPPENRRLYLELWRGGERLLNAQAERVGLKRYVVDLPALAVRSGLARVLDASGEELLRTPVALGQPRELLETGGDASRLRAVAEASGGKVFQNPADFGPEFLKLAGRSPRPLGALLAGAALALVAVELLVRLFARRANS